MPPKLNSKSKCEFLKKIIKENGQNFPQIWRNMWQFYFFFFFFALWKFPHTTKRKKNIKKMLLIMGAHFSQVSCGWKEGWYCYAHHGWKSGMGGGGGWEKGMKKRPMWWWGVEWINLPFFGQNSCPNSRPSSSYNLLTHKCCWFLTIGLLG